MAFVAADIKIPEMERTLHTQLYFPTDLPEAVGNKVKGVITLLHGVSNTAADWMMMSAAPRYAADNGYVLVAPSVDNSFYADMAYGAPFYTCLTQWLPAQLERIFRIPAQRDKNFIAGLSMGGYGALLLALRNPGRWAAAGSFSGCLDIRAMAAATNGVPLYGNMMRAAFGSPPVVPDDADLMLLARKAACLDTAQQPRIFCTCGQQDDTFGRIRTQNHNFREAVKDLPLDYTYREWPGVHEWNFWDRSLAEFIEFVQKSDYARRKCADWSTGHGPAQ